MVHRDDPPIHRVDVDISRIEEWKKKGDEESDDRQNQSGLERYSTSVSLSQEDQEAFDCDHQSRHREDDKHPEGSVA